TKQKKQTREPKKTGMFSLFRRKNENEASPVQTEEPNNTVHQKSDVLTPQTPQEIPQIRTDLRVAPIVTPNPDATSVLGISGADETTVLGSGAHQIPYLIRIKNGQKKYIDKPVYRIGTEKSFVDFYINNTAVSRNHADIM